jgi:chemotaxis protein histidine kinase CheA
LKQPFSRYLAFLLLFPCWLSAQDVTEQAVQAPDSSLTPTAVPTPTEVSTTAENPAPAAIPQIDSASATPINYEITSYEPIKATDSSQTAIDSTLPKPEFVEQAPDTTANAVPETASAATAEIPVADTTAKPQQQTTDTLQQVTEQQVQPDTTQPVADTTKKEQQPQVAEAKQKTEEPQPKAKENKQETEKTPAKKDNKPKRVWGGFTAGITYNDFYSTKFGLDDINHGKDISLSVSGAEDLLNSYWGVGFKFGFGFMFMPNAYFNLRSDLTLALRQGTGKTNASVILSKKEAEQKEKSDLKIEYSTSQLNIDWPILARVSIPKGIYFDAGPMFSFNVYAKNKVTIKDYYGSKTFEEKGGLNAFEFDIATGLGVMRHIGKSILDVDLRFIFGMTRISDANDAPKTWQGQLNITYWFL